MNPPIELTEREAKTAAYFEFVACEVQKQFEDTRASLDRLLKADMRMESPEAVQRYRFAVEHYQRQSDTLSATAKTYSDCAQVLRNGLTLKWL